MPIHIAEQTGFLHIVGRHPYRFILGACTLGLCIVCGASSSVIFHAQATPQTTLSGYLDINAALLWRALLCAAAWQAMLTCAVSYAREGGGRIAAALFAFGIEGFTYGFTLSELLFVYGGKGVWAACMGTAMCGMMGIVLRLYWFLREETAPADVGKRKARARIENVRLLYRLTMLVLLQGGVTPLLVYLLRAD